MTGSDHSGSRSAWQPQPGAGQAGVPLQGKSPMEVQAMVALQEVLAPLLHYLSMHQMCALSRLLCDHIKTAAHHTSATHSAAPAPAYAAEGHTEAGANGGPALVGAGAATVGDDTDDDSEEDEEVARGAAGPTWVRLLQRSMQELGLAKMLLGSCIRAGSGRVGRGSSKGVGGSGLLRQRLRAKATTLPGCGGCAVGGPPEASSVGHLPASPPAGKVQLLAAACGGGAAPGHANHLPWRSQRGVCLAPRLLRCAGVLLAMAFCLAGLEVTLRQVGLPPLLGAPHLQWLH